MNGVLRTSERDSQKLLELAADAAHMGTWQIDWSTKEVFLCSRMAELVGLPPGTTRLPLHEWREKVLQLHLDRIQGILGTVDEAVQEDTPRQYRVETPFGEERWISAQGAIIKDDYSGSPVRSLGVVLDITKQKADETRQNESEAEFRAVFEDSALAKGLADPASGEIVRVNRAFCELLGYSKEELIGKSFYDITHPEHRDSEHAAYARLLKGETLLHDTEKRYLRKNGTILWVRVTATLVGRSSGGPLRAAAIIENLTEKKRLEEKLKETEFLFTEFANANVLGIRMGQIGRRPTYVNDEYLRIVGYSREEFENSLLKEETLCAFEMPDALTEAQTRGSCTPHEVEFTRSDGIKVFLLVGCMLYGPAGDHRLSFVLDISKRKRTEDELRDARQSAEVANRIKDEFLATVSHELRSPLNAILGYANLLLKGEKSREELRTGLEVISRNARAQATIIDDLLDISRIISGNLLLDVRRVELVPIVESVIASVQPAADVKTLRINSKLDRDLPAISGDAVRIQQIVWNLLNNAAKFTPPGGSISVELKQVGTNVELLVSDTGIGIAPDFVPLLFDRFRQAESGSTRKYVGLGIGLSIVKHLVEMHGGTVHAESPGEGKGATFVVSFPIASVVFRADRDEKVSNAVVPEVADHSFTSLGGIKVLVVDDEQDARQLIRSVLEESGAQVESVSSAREAMDSLPQFKPDLILSDLSMPGEDGFSLISRIRELTPEAGGNVPAAALTAYATKEDQRKAVRAGYQRHIAKPVDPAELTEIVASMTKGASAPSMH